MSLDGFVAGPKGELDWIFFGQQDEAIFERILALADSCDTILMGRKMTPGFISYWEDVVDNKPDSAELPLAKRMVDMKKIVFSHSNPNIQGRNLSPENGDLTAKVMSLKKMPGKDLMVYGGASFVNSLIDQNLVDEYYIFRRPVAIGSGLSIFSTQKILKLEDSTTYKNGTSLDKFTPA